MALTGGGRRATDQNALGRLGATLEFLSENVAEIKSDIKEMKNDTATRITAIENNKLSKDEAERMLAEANKIHEAQAEDIQRLVDIVEKLKDRQTYWLGGLAVINIVLGIAVAVALKLF